MRIAFVSCPRTRAFFPPVPLFYGDLRMTRGKRIYVLDTNVLMHDPTALFRFEEHDVFLPMTVLEELDAAKKGTSEVSRNARQVSRFINELIENGNGKHIEHGLELRLPQGIQLERGANVGRLYFQTLEIDEPVAGKKRQLPDNLILASIVALRERKNKSANDGQAVLVSKDINLRIKASIYGIAAEDYENDKALDDFSLLFAGHTELPADFWERHPEVRSWSERGHTFYEMKQLGDEDGIRTSSFTCPRKTMSSCACCECMKASPPCRSWRISATARIRCGA